MDHVKTKTVIVGGLTFGFFHYLFSIVQENPTLVIAFSLAYAVLVGYTFYSTYGSKERYNESIPVSAN